MIIPKKQILTQILKKLDNIPRPHYLPTESEYDHFIISHSE